MDFDAMGSASSFIESSIGSIFFELVNTPIGFQLGFQRRRLWLFHRNIDRILIKQGFDETV